MEIIKVIDINEEKIGLATLLKEIVEGGASIGFLPGMAMKEAEDYWANVLSPGTMLFVAKLNGELAGTVQVYLEQKPNGVHRGEIKKLMVHSKFRRRGAARRLMQAAEEAAKRENRSLLVLDTREGDPSNDLYLSLDYCAAGRIPGFALSHDGSKEATILYYKELI